MGRKRREPPDEYTEITRAICGHPAVATMPLFWGGYIIRPTDRKYSSIYDVPNDCGVYAWYSKEGDLLYVGRSVAMNSRLRQHHMPFFGGELVSYRIVPQMYLNGVEMAHIATLAPSENKARNVAHLDFWDEFCEAIDAAWLDVLPAMNARVSARNHALMEEIAERIAANHRHSR